MARGRGVVFVFVGVVSHGGVTTFAVVVLVLCLLLVGGGVALFRAWRRVEAERAALAARHEALARAAADGLGTPAAVIMGVARILKESFGDTVEADDDLAQLFDVLDRNARVLRRRMEDVGALLDPDPSPDLPSPVAVRDAPPLVAPSTCGFGARGSRR